MHGFLFSYPSASSAPFRVVVLYEDVAMRKRAQRVCRFVAGQVSESRGFDRGVWHCEPLQDGRLRNRVAGEVAGADLVVLPVSRALPAGSGALLGAWLKAKRCRDSALVAMADGADATATQPGGAASVQLARLAREHGLTFFRERLDIPEGPGRGSWQLVWVF
jgi:hypothetical protein